MTPERIHKSVFEYTEADIAELDQPLVVPFFYETRKRFKAWRKRRALARRAAAGDPVAAREIAEGDGVV
jgi:hypothetical protein